jgi:hypothetical protein
LIDNESFQFSPFFTVVNKDQLRWYMLVSKAFQRPDGRHVIVSTR